MKKFLTTLAAIILCSTSTLASDWRGVDGHYIDVNSIVKYRNNIYAYWVKSDISARGIDNYKKFIKNEKFNEVRVRQLIDCDKQKIAVLSMADFDAQGNLLHTFSFNDYQLKWNDIIPDTMLEVEYYLICQPNKQY